MKGLAKLNGMQLSLSTFWNERNQRERTMLVAAIAVVVAGLFYMLLIDPAMSGRQNFEKRLPALRQQAAELQAMAKEARTLAGKTAAPVTTVTRESLEASLANKGLKPQSVSLTGGLAKVQLSSASFAALADWLDEVQRTARLSVVDANIEALAEVDTVNATLTLRRQSNEQTQ